jgi:DNA-binding NarL/FixJ family response regulator
MSVAAAARQIRVLIVDDHELVRAGLRTLLQAEPDLEVVGEAATGSQALMHARRLQPDVVLLDARLPDMSGPDVCRGLDAALPQVAVAILTTFTDDELVRQCVRAGARGYLLKDVPGLDLAASVRSLAGGEPVIDRKVLPQVLTVARQSADSADPDHPLNERPRTILRLVADGLSNRQVAEQIHLSELTVKKLHRGFAETTWGAQQSPRCHHRHPQRLALTFAYGSCRRDRQLSFPRLERVYALLHNRISAGDCLMSEDTEAGRGIASLL